MVYIHVLFVKLKQVMRLMRFVYITEYRNDVEYFGFDFFKLSIDKALLKNFPFSDLKRSSRLNFRSKRSKEEAFVFW
jgi:hypothetical protein